MWCIGQMTGDYLARMENVLSLYHLPLDEKRPVICLDELPFQMLGEKVEPLPMKSGAPRKFDNAVVSGGSVSARDEDSSGDGQSGDTFTRSRL